MLGSRFPQGPSPALVHQSGSSIASYSHCLNSPHILLGKEEHCPNWLTCFVLPGERKFSPENEIILLVGLCYPKQNTSKWFLRITHQNLKHTQHQTFQIFCMTQITFSCRNIIRTTASRTFSTQGIILLCLITSWLSCCREVGRELEPHPLGFQ